MLVINICIDNIYTYAHMCMGYTMAYKALHDLTCPLAPCHDPPLLTSPPRSAPPTLATLLSETPRLPACLRVLQWPSRKLS